MALSETQKRQMERNAEYWRERTAILEQAQYDKSIAYFDTLQTQYQKAIAQTEKDINAWYARFATENKVTFQEAQKMLNTRELDEFKWTVDDYIKYGKENAVSGQWITQLENASARYHITRLEALKVQMQHQAEVLMGNEVDGVTSLIESIYTDSYYRSIFDIQRGTGVGFSFAILDKDGVQRVMSKPWTADGTNFSQRIWGKHRPELVSDLHEQLTQATIRGDNPQTLVAKIAKKYGATKSQAENLCLTEGAYFRSRGQLEGYKESGVDEYEICATLDNKTTEICRDMDGKHFPISKWEVGTTAPPFHGRCRTATMPYFDDEFTKDEKRIARNEEGKSYYVDGDMTYRTWAKKYAGKEVAENIADTVVGALGDRIANIKVDYDELRAKEKGIQADIDAKNNELKEIPIQDIDYQNKRWALQRQYDEYKQFDGIDIDDQYNKLQGKKSALADELQELEKEHDRYYTRPERGTPDYDEWRKFRKEYDFEKEFNNIVDCKMKISNIDNDLDKIGKMRNGDIDLKSIKKQIAEYDDLIAENVLKKDRLTKDINNLKSKLKPLRDEIETVTKRAGRELKEELTEAVTKRSTAINKAYEAKNAAYEKYRANEITYEEYRKISEEWWKLKEKAPLEYANELKTALSKVRKVGTGDINISAHLNNSRSTVKKSIQDAYDYYPTEWVEKSVAKGTLTPRKSDRGYYSEAREVIAISGSSYNSQFETAIHELGHRYERAVPEILTAESNFYARRTEGEVLEWLGRGYARSEKTRKDDFIDAYMGKDYGGSAYELVSMGFQRAYIDPSKLFNDVDMSEFIYGILCLY